MSKQPRRERKQLHPDRGQPRRGQSRGDRNQPRLARRQVRPDRRQPRDDLGQSRLERRVADAVYRNSFGAFVYAAFQAVNPGKRLTPSWHIDHVSHHLEVMVTRRNRERLVLNQPPRTLKSFIASVALPAWLLGWDPSATIICASYSQELANKFSRDCRALIDSKVYKRIFPGTCLNPKKATESEFETTRRGYRLATSVGGTLTGRGGDFMIVDDPSKADDANSVVALEGASAWFHDTAINRLDDSAKSVVIVVQQRLHVKDLSGILIEKGWPSLVLPAIATEARDYILGDGEIYHRPVGELLQPARDTREDLEKKRLELGSHLFAAQYQQNPTPAEGNMVKRAWLGRYPTALPRNQYRRVVLSCDPAGKAGDHNDYTAITVVGVKPKELHLLHAARGHWKVLEMQDQILRLPKQLDVDLVIVEDKQRHAIDPVAQGEAKLKCDRAASQRRQASQTEPASRPI